MRGKTGSKEKNKTKGRIESQPEPETCLRSFSVYI